MSLWRCKPDAVTQLGETQVGIVFAQQQAVFSAGGEHPIRLAIGAFGDQVVDENPDVRLIP